MDQFGESHICKTIGIALLPCLDTKYVMDMNTTERIDWHTHKSCHCCPLSLSHCMKQYVLNNVVFFTLWVSVNSASHCWHSGDRSKLMAILIYQPDFNIDIYLLFFIRFSWIGLQAVKKAQMDTSLW